MDIRPLNYKDIDSLVERGENAIREHYNREPLEDEVENTVLAYSIEGKGIVVALEGSVVIGFIAYSLVGDEVLIEHTVMDKHSGSNVFENMVKYVKYTIGNGNKTIISLPRRIKSKFLTITNYIYEVN